MNKTSYYKINVRKEIQNREEKKDLKILVHSSFYA